jgi:hypothetical protein
MARGEIEGYVVSLVKDGERIPEERGRLQAIMIKLML